MDNTPPALWEHVERTYTAMEANSDRELLVDGNAEDVEVSVYEGFLSRLMFEELGIPVPAYGKVLGVLKEMGCATQLRRGGGSSPSRWALWKDPTLELFYEAYEGVSPSKSQYYREIDIFKGQIADIREALGGVNVPQALKDVMDTLLKLDKRVSALEGQSSYDNS